MGAQGAFFAAVGVLFFAAAAAQVTEITISPESLGVDDAFLMVQSMVSTDDPMPGQSTVTVNVKTNVPITGFTFFFSSSQFPFMADVMLVSAGGAANTFNGVVFPGLGMAQGGSQAAAIFAPNPPLPVSFGPTCTTTANCLSSSFVEFATFVVMTPPSGQVFLFGPGGDNMDSPVFDIPVDFPVPVAMTSDPHFKGLRGQEYDFTGEPGKIYSIVSDRGLALNALFSRGYTTGISTNTESMTVANMYEKGTWVWAMGIILQDNSITISCEPSQLAASLCPTTSQNDLCFMGGTIEVNGNEIVRLGNLLIDEEKELSINLYNSKSFGRVSIMSPFLEAKFDYVPAPASWDIASNDASTYAHLNMQITSIILSDAAHGVLGQTSQAGKAGLEASDMNGTGLLDGQPSDYELSDLLSTDFKFSAFQE